MHEGRTVWPASPLSLEAKTLHCILNGSTFHCLISSSSHDNSMNSSQHPTQSIPHPLSWNAYPQKARDANKRTLVIQAHFLLKEILMTCVFGKMVKRDKSSFFFPIPSSPADYHPCLLSFSVVDSREPERSISR